MTGGVAGPRRLVLQALLAAGTVLVLYSPGCHGGPPAVVADPNALLRAMSDRLAAARTLSFSTSEVHERRRGLGKLEVRLSREWLVRRPDRIVFKVAGGESDASGTYDGSSLTLLWPVQGVYAQVEMPPTIDQMLDRLAEHFRMPLPVADLLYSLPYDRLLGQGSGSRYDGRDVVRGVACHHLAYLDPQVDWHVWIPAEGDPLPRELDITSKGRLGHLTSHVQFNGWDLAATVPPGAFSPDIPKGYERVRVVVYPTPRASSAGDH